uniref:Uncharacterized protein n=1 Tax=virus sp. ctBM815 TaxID=2825806 RepID=A0A8S5RKT3_9VIRU|nr:MAG TPA: hypothetical protein [virus sp. ctBM815]DAV23966.1 MAG TPA: hypothetical protein [Bacteriophage sp.]
MASFSSLYFTVFKDFRYDFIWLISQEVIAVFIRKVRVDSFSFIFK